MFWPWRKRTDVWFDGYKHGFSQAWTVMAPLISNSIAESKKVIESSAIDQTLERLNGKLH